MAVAMESPLSVRPSSSGGRPPAGNGRQPSKSSQPGGILKATSRPSSSLRQLPPEPTIAPASKPSAARTSRSITMNITRPNGESLLSINPDHSWNVAKLKSIIEEASGIPVEAQRLLHEEDELQDTQALAKHFVNDDVNVTLVVCHDLKLSEWQNIQRNPGRWQEILKAVQNGKFSEPGPLRVVAHQLWPMLGPYQDEANWSNPDFVRRAADIEVSLLALASPELTADRQFMLDQIATFGGSLKFAAPELCTDWEFVVNAVRTNFFAAQSIHPALTADENFVKTVLGVSPVVSHMLPRSVLVTA